MGKKNYCTPNTEVMELELENHLLAASGESEDIENGSEVGGGTDIIDAKSHSGDTGDFSVW